MSTSNLNLNSSPSNCRVGKPAPDFLMTCVDIHTKQPHNIRLADYRGRWLILIFSPLDFSFVCPTELTSFSARITDFHDRQCDLLGISVDPIESHIRWLATPPENGGLGPLQFPLASELEGNIFNQYGVWDEEKQVATRGLFIIDPAGLLQYSVVHNLSIGRNVEEVLRVLNALDTGGLCPASWTTADGTLDVEASLQSGRVIGHYRIENRLGNGTFGTVFSAWDLRLERLVALKVLKQTLLQSHKSLLNEARVAAKLNHPCVCTIYAVEREDGLPLIAMEFIDGQSLPHRIAAGLDPTEVHPLAIHIAHGLAAAHHGTVVHGDLKPANIMLTAQGTPKILDFGLAKLNQPGLVDRETSYLAHPTKHLDSDATTDLDKTAWWNTVTAGNTEKNNQPIGGTPAYMSPEQAIGEYPTMASDVFSFGLLLFEMLTGTRALANQSYSELMARLQSKDLASQLADQVPTPYQTVLEVTLQYNAARRPSMDTIIRLLSEIDYS